LPYTISHTALVLPFARWLARLRLLSAVLVGAMVPDFAVFSPWKLGRIETHSAEALLTFCLPVGLVTYWIFQFFIKPAMAQILPDGPYARWHTYAAPEPILQVRQWLLAAVGILAGAVSHLALDGFTHTAGRGVLLFPALDEPLFDIGHRHIIATRLMQDLGSLIGLIVVFAIALHALRRGTDQPIAHRLLSRTERHSWAVTYGLATVLLSGLFYMWAHEGSGPGSHQIMALVYDGAVAVLRGLAAAVLGVSLGLTVRLRTLG
jgi:hypothetical protein